MSSPRSSRWLRYINEGAVKAEAKGETVGEPIPLLQRPLGVKEPPSTAQKTWADKRNELMNQDIRMAQRKHLCANDRSTTLITRR